MLWVLKTKQTQKKQILNKGVNYEEIYFDYWT